MSTPTAYKFALDKFHEVEQRLPIDRVLDTNFLPDDVVARLTDDLGDGVEALKHAVAPAAAVALDTSRQAVGTTRRLVQRRPWLVVGGLVLAVGAIALVVARRRDSDDRSHRADLASAA